MSFHILEENVKMEGKMNLQDTFLNEARKKMRLSAFFDEWRSTEGQGKVL